MAFLIKNPVINEARKQQVAEHPHEDTIDIHPPQEGLMENEAKINHYDTTSRAIMGQISDSGYNTENEVTFLDDKLLYKGKYYLPEEEIDQYITTEVQLRKMELDNELNEVIKNAQDKGYGDGLLQAAKEYETKKSEIIELFGKINHVYSEKIEEAEDFLKEIVFVAVCKSFGELLKNREERLLVIENAVANIKNTNPIKIKISQKDYNALFENKDSELSDKYNIEVDGRIELGGCIVETENGIFDGRLEVQLAKLNEAIRAHIND